MFPSAARPLSMSSCGGRSPLFLWSSDAPWQTPTQSGLLFGYATSAVSGNRRTPASRPCSSPGIHRLRIPGFEALYTAVKSLAGSHPSFGHPNLAGASGNSNLARTGYRNLLIFMAATVDEVQGNEFSQVHSCRAALIFGGTGFGTLFSMIVVVCTRQCCCAVRGHFLLTAFQQPNASVSPGRIHEFCLLIKCGASRMW